MCNKLTKNEFTCDDAAAFCMSCLCEIKTSENTDKTDGFTTQHANLDGFTTQHANSDGFTTELIDYTVVSFGYLKRTH